MTFRLLLVEGPHRRGRVQTRFCSLDMTPPFTGDETVRGGPVEHHAGTRARTMLRVRRNVLGVLPILTNTRAYSAPPLPVQIRSIHPAHHPRSSARKKWWTSRGMRDCRSGNRTALGVLRSPLVTQWLRVLSRVTSASPEWHIPRIKSFTTTTYCGTELEGPLEAASDDKAEREGRCSPCVTQLATTQGIVPQRVSRLMARARTTPVKKVAAKRTAAKRTLRRLAPKGRSGKAPVVKRRVRRSRGGKA
jgi:hypothetical protein